MSLCTRNQVKTRLAIPAGQSQFDDILDQIVAGVSGLLVGRMGCNRPLEQASFTHALDVHYADQRRLCLPVWPVVSIASVKERWELAAWAEQTALVAGTDYEADAENGILARIGTCWPQGIQAVQVAYTAGYVPPSVSTAPGFVLASGQVLLPEEVVEAAIQQCIHVFQRRDNPAQGGGSVQNSNAYYPAMLGAAELLPGVAEVLRSARYRRAM